MSLESAGRDEELAAGSIALAVVYSFSLIEEPTRSRIDYDRLLPVLLGSSLFSQDGYRSGRLFEDINRDVNEVYTEAQRKLAWPSESSSFLRFQAMITQPLVQTMGPMSRLIAHTVTHLQQPWLIQTAMDDLLAFARILESSWRQCRLSSIDAAQESTAFDGATSSTSLPLLWRSLRSALFAITIILRGVMTRLLTDRALSTDDVAPELALQTLHTLRHLYFILTHHATPSAFSPHTFVNLTALDILSAYPKAASSFLDSVRPSVNPNHPLDLVNLLYYLNTAEHLALSLPLSSTTPLIQVATPYLTPNPIPILSSSALKTPIFESAHSLVLAVLASPQNAILTSHHLPFYAETVLQLFPADISERQFRLAMKTLVRVASPPSDVSSRVPEMAEVLMELMRYRAETGAEELQSPNQNGGGDKTGDTGAVATLVLAMIDSLPFLAPGVLLNWLSLVADSIGYVKVENERDKCRERFWDCISNGEMDVERAGLCVMWWGELRGRERLWGAAEGREEAMMSGALVNEGAVGDAKL
ncbi:MAG: hypothetical protein Q9159_002544 [Coniocarpon cinnabarinum]